MDLSGEDLQIMAGAIKYVSEDRVYCTDDKVYLVAWGMTPDVRQHKVVGSVIHDFEYTKKYKITFDAGEHGTISKLDKPSVVPKDRYFKIGYTYSGCL